MFGKFNAKNVQQNIERSKNSVKMFESDSFEKSYWQVGVCPNE